MYNKSFSTFLAAIIFLSSPSLSAQQTDLTFSEKVWDYMVNGATLTLGVGVRQAGIKVVRTADKAEGTLVQHNDEAYFISYSTRPAYLDSSHNVGYTFVFNLTSFDADQQQVGPDLYEDIGTRASGDLFYVVPTLFYEWGNYRDDFFTRIGLGLGIGFTRFDGDIILTESNDQERLELSSKASKLRLASSLIFETRWNHWGLSLTVAGPGYENDDYEVQVQSTTINLGYSFVF